MNLVCLNYSNSQELVKKAKAEKKADEAAKQKKKEEARKAAAAKAALIPTYRPAFVPPKPVNNQPVKKQPQFDRSQLKVGLKVQHRSFGAGRIEAMDNNVLIVKFERFSETKKLAIWSFDNGTMSIAE